MWVRKSEAEIKDYLDRQEARRKSLLRPFLFALALTVVALTLYSLGYRGGSLRSGLVVVSDPVDFAAGIILPAVFLFGFFFVIALYRTRRKRAYSASDYLLCANCKEPSSANPSAVCQCGGTLEPFAFFEWREDEKPGEAS